MPLTARGGGKHRVISQYAMEHLRMHGLIEARWFRVGFLGVQVWFLPEQLAAYYELHRRLNAWGLTVDDWPPDAC